MSGSHAKKTRNSWLKKVRRTECLTCQGHFGDPYRDQLAEMLEQIISQCEALLETEAGTTKPIDHPLPFLGDESRQNKAIERTIDVIKSALLSHDYRVFAILASELRRLGNRKLDRLDANRQRELIELLCEAQKGPVNLAALAVRLVTGQKLSTQRARSPSQETQIESTARRLRRYCRLNRIPVRGAGRPPRNPDK